MRKALLIAFATAALAGCVEVRAKQVQASASIVLDQVKEQAKQKCSVIPQTTSLLAIINAAAGRIDADTLVDIACGALKVYEAYASGKGEPSRRVRPGDTVKGTAIVNGKEVPVKGTVVKRK